MGACGMHVIALVNSKGGVGKSTLCAALAVRAAKDSDRVALVDMDPQRSLADWYEMRGGDAAGSPRVFANADMASDVRERLERDGWDWCFMDGPPGAVRKLEEMVAACDVAVIPVRASTLDVLATTDA